MGWFCDILNADMYICCRFIYRVFLKSIFIVKSRSIINNTEYLPILSWIFPFPSKFCLTIFFFHVEKEIATEMITETETVTEIVTAIEIVTETEIATDVTVATVRTVLARTAGATTGLTGGGRRTGSATRRARATMTMTNDSHRRLGLETRFFSHYLKVVFSHGFVRFLRYY